MKQVKYKILYASAFGQPRYLQRIEINGFTTSYNRAKDNLDFAEAIWKLVRKYNIKTDKRLRESKYRNLAFIGNKSKGLVH